jgi:DNA-binding LacI/PurR family transcriptional regulator
MTISVEVDPETEARIRADAESLGIRPGQFAGAFIEGLLKAREAGHEDPSRAAMSFVYEKFSKK